PIMLDVTDRRCVVVGGGHVALQKVSALLDAGAHVRVVALRVCDELRHRDGVDVCDNAYQAAALDGAALVVAATDSPETNARVFADCRAHGILCNVVDRPDCCDFILPSVLRRGPLTVAVSTGGASPALAGRIRRRLEDEFDEAYGVYLEAIGRVRAQVRRQVNDEALRRQIAHELAAEELLEAARQGKAALDRAIRTILEHHGVVAGDDDAETD
ncbi:MAG: bifunctional precorrin-2 dehydrogenase/sirohydrochlorin ferrochelatase, partial [Planctomycetes bacterium]|nr:bifunctional precorrin-2 dehydrogenase/sirohydrochlorin ferrochelatase [Planctomycetota bacterium]